MSEPNENTLDIVSLIEMTPMTRLSGEYRSKMLEKVKSVFTDEQQQLFVTSYYCYLNHHPTRDFVIDLDNVWKWLAFSTKQKAKELLYKQFVLDNDYKILLNQHVKQVNKEKHGGHNKETIMMNINTFKLFCIKAGTKKADQIHEYFIKLEEIMHELVQEESDELKLQLEHYKINLKMDKELVREKALLEQFPRNTQCIYYGFIENTNSDQEKLIKFGHSNDLTPRVETHKRTYEHFRLANVFRVENSTRIENEMKNHPTLKLHRRTLDIQGTNYNELFGNLPPHQLDKIIQEIVTNIEYSAENYTKLWDKTKKMTEQIHALKIHVKQLSEENHRIKLEFQEHLWAQRTTIPVPDTTTTTTTISPISNIILDTTTTEPKKIKRKINIKQMITPIIVPTTSSELEPPPPPPILRTRIRRFQRHRDGFFHINGQTYQKLSGTREQVWDHHAYRTEGQLTRDQLTINPQGKIVSIKKRTTSILEPRPICVALPHNVIIPTQ
jgi:regulator of replication initiation timing